MRNTKLEDLADSPIFNVTTSQCDGRRTPIVKCDHVDYPGLFNRVEHEPSFAARSSKRFFANDMFPGFRSRNSDLGVAVVGCYDVDQIDIRSVYSFAPIGGALLKSESLAGLFCKSIGAIH